MVKGKHAKLGNIQLNSGGIIEELEADQCYKYLGIDELTEIKHEEMKEKTNKNMKAKLRKLLETELNARNLFQAINEAVLPLITYTYGIINWNEDELKGHDIQIRKMLNMYRAFELKSDIDRLYLPQEMGGRGLISIWDSFQASTSQIAHAMSNTSNEILQQCIEAEKKCLFSNITRAEKYEANVTLELPKNFLEKPVLTQARLKAAAMKKELTKKRSESFMAKPQHCAYMRLIEESDADTKLSMAWLRKSYIDPHTESYICGAQELATMTRYHERHILKNRDDDLCRMCKQSPETVFHILGACDTLAKREYFTRHNNICQYIHFKALQHFKVETGDNWFRHKPMDVVLRNNVEIIYDQFIATSRPIGANRPDIIIKDVANKKAFIIDISCPVDTNVNKKEMEKLSKYGGLRVELERMWGVKAEIVPVIVGGLGAVTKNLADYLAKIPGTPDLHMCQKICLLGSKRILTDVLKRK